jgi:hypothetical protein
MALTMSKHAAAVLNDKQLTQTKSVQPVTGGPKLGLCEWCACRYSLSASKRQVFASHVAGSCYYKLSRPALLAPKQHTAAVVARCHCSSVLDLLRCYCDPGHRPSPEHNAIAVMLYS